MKYGLFFSLASHFLSHSSLTETWKCHSKMADSLMQGTPHTGSASIMGWVFCRCRTEGVSNGSIRHTRPGGSPRLGTRGHAQIRPTVFPQTRNGMETLILQNLTQWHPGLAAPNMGSYSMACVAWTVTIGFYKGNVVHVTSGLSDRDRLIVVGHRQLRDGQRVTVQRHDE